MVVHGDLVYIVPPQSYFDISMEHYGLSKVAQLRGMARNVHDTQPIQRSMEQEAR